MNKKIVLISSCLLSFMMAPMASSAATIKSNQKIQTQQQLKADLSNVQLQKQLVQDEIDLTTKKIAKLNQQITKSDADIQKKEQEITKIKQELDQLSTEEIRITTLLNNRKDEFKNRAASYYRTQGQMSFLNVIFSVNSFGEFIDHFVAYDKIVNEDKRFIAAYIADQNKVAGIKANVETLQKSAVQEKADLEKIKKDQVSNKKEKETLTSFLEKKKKQLEKEEQQKKVALELLQKNGKDILAFLNQNSSNASANYAPLIKSIIDPFIADAQKLQQKKGVPASITLGQIILESSGSYNGLSGLAYSAKNLFGMKGTGTAGSVSWDTTEYVNGHYTAQKAQFAKYKTYYDSMVSHANLLLTPRYQQYLHNVTSIVDYANGILAAGYATDPNYADKLLRIIYQYDLWKLDV